MTSAASRADTRELQTRLNESGFAYSLLGEALEVDGIYGPNTDRVHRAWLDRDTAIPTLTPPPALPWWRKKSVLVMAAGVLAGGAGLAGYNVETSQIHEILSALAGLVTLVLGVLQTAKGEAPVDPTLLARLPARDLRFSGLRQRVPVPPGSQPNRSQGDARGAFETE